MTDYLNYVFWNNSLKAWLTSVFIMVAAVIVVRLFARFGVRRWNNWTLKTKTTWDDFLVTLIRRSLVPIAYIVSIYFSLSTLALPDQVRKVLHVALLVSLTYFLLRAISSAFRKLVHSYIRGRENSEDKEKQASGLIIIANVIIWIAGFVFLIDNLGYNVTTLVAGLGIGGIAIALAAQAVLGDLFSYFVIFFDRPFEIGDFIIVDDKSGTIEHIGIKTTRIRTLGGEQLVCSNTDLTNARLHNYKRLEKRRVLFNLGVTYQTSHEQLKRIPALVEDIITAQPGVSFDRGHFSSYGDSSLNFEFVYYILDSDYNVYMDKQQTIYLNIFAVFEKESIEFAYPTQTLFIQAPSIPPEEK